MAKYIQMIDAVQWTGDNIEEIREFIGDDMVASNTKYNGEPDDLMIWDKRSEIDFVKININEYIIKYPDGMIGYCDPEIFNIQYKPAPEPEFKSKYKSKYGH